MTKQYKGRTATIEIDEKNVIIKSSGFFSSSKKTLSPYGFSITK